MYSEFDWVEDEYYRGRILERGIEPERLISDAAFIGVDGQVLRRYVEYGLDDDLFAILSHAQALRKLDDVFLNPQEEGKKDV